MNKSMIGALVIAMALLPSFASATASPYFERIGEKHNYTVPGVLNVEPVLDQDAGNARMNSKVFLGTQWLVEVECLSTSLVDCSGDIVS